MVEKIKQITVLHHDPSTVQGRCCVFTEYVWVGRRFTEKTSSLNKELRDSHKVYCLPEKIFQTLPNRNFQERSWLKPLARPSSLEPLYAVSGSCSSRDSRLPPHRAGTGRWPADWDTFGQSADTGVGWNGDSDFVTWNVEWNVSVRNIKMLLKLENEISCNTGTFRLKLWILSSLKCIFPNIW